MARLHATGLRLAARAVIPALMTTAMLLPAQPLRAQSLQPGEGYVTRFSGVVASGPQGEQLAIDLEGTVGSIFDLRAPRQPPQGQHWVDEPQRQPLKASQVGQVFGIALDGENPPNIFVTATPAFGLHRTPDNAQWMPGMWGPGGPGGVYRLDSRTGQPSVFAQIGLDGRPNTGAALGNIAYDRWNKQFFVSDLETGMIHRLRGTDGADLGVWDHGTQARAEFFDPDSKQPNRLAPIPFNPSSRARITDCPGGAFATTPECWNLAASGRRVWGLGVMRNAKTGEVRLYYAVASSPDFGNKQWAALPEEEKRNSVWSVQLGPDGGFAGNVRREFILPDFFVSGDDIARAGYSHPASDITFPVCINRGVMLVAERGGIRNLGLAEQNPFAEPYESRLLRYELDHEGVWRPVGRYDVGMRERQPEEGPPIMQSNCAGGATFGYGYDPKSWTIAPSQPDQFVWTSGDALCSALGPCNAPGLAEAVGAGAGPIAKGKAGPRGTAPQPASEITEEAQHAGDIEVHGIQGIAEGAFQQLSPLAAALGVPGTRGAAQPKGGGPLTAQAQGSIVNEAYLVDTDINFDPTGKADVEDVPINKATMIGDVVIHQICDVPLMGFVPSAAPPVLVAGVGHSAAISHSMYESHGRANSHFRFGSHSPYISHNRYQSHYRYWSHYREGSHNRWWSHERRGSIHNRYATHLRFGSQHDRELSHRRIGSLHHRLLTHQRFGSPHDRRLTHQRFGSPHDRVLTHQRRGSVHERRLSHDRIGTPHNRALTHQRVASPHNRVLSHDRTGTPHNRLVSHKRFGSDHNRVRSQGGEVPKKEHTRALSQAKTGVHQPPAGPAHNQALSHSREGSGHNPRVSHIRAGSPQKKNIPMHRPSVSHARTGSKATGHNTRLSHQRTGSTQKKHHAAAASHQRAGSAQRKQQFHNPAASQQRFNPGGNRPVPRAMNNRPGFRR